MFFAQSKFQPGLGCCNKWVLKMKELELHRFLSLVPFAKDPLLASNYLGFDCGSHEFEPAKLSPLISSRSDLSSGGHSDLSEEPLLLRAHHQLPHHLKGSETQKPTSQKETTQDITYPPSKNHGTAQVPKSTTRQKVAL